MFDDQAYSLPFDEVGECLDFKDPVTRFQFQDFKTYLLDDILTKVDRMSMANSLEVRVPLLDHKVVEFAFSLPLSLKIHQNGDVIMKYLLKKSAASFFLDSFLNRKKMGFGIPIVKWVRNDFRPYIEDDLRNKNNGIYDWVRYRLVQRLIDRCYNGDNSQVAKVWILWMLSLWVKNNHNGGTIAKN